MADLASHSVHTTSFPSTLPPPFLPTACCYPSSLPARPILSNAQSMSASWPSMLIDTSDSKQDLQQQQQQEETDAH